MVKVGNLDHEKRNIGKAGKKKKARFRPTVRGVAMNPVDHHTVVVKVELQVVDTRLHHGENRLKDIEQETTRKQINL